MLPLGTTAPNFELTEVVSGSKMALADVKGSEGSVVLFICAHCPFVVHIEESLAKLAKAYKEKGIAFIAISSNNVETHPQDGPEGLKEQALRVGFDFPYFYDETQEVAKAYNAACTPDFYLFDSDLALVYRGRMDGATPGNAVENDGVDLRLAMENLLANKAQSEEQIPSMGCNIKWK